MAPGGAVVPPPEKRTGAWLYVKRDTVPGRTNCRDEGCRWGTTPNKTRARDHLVGCAEASRSFPKMMGVLMWQAPAPGALPPATAAQLHEWRMLWTEAMCESCLPLGCFETAAWRAALGAVTTGRFTGPGDRRTLATTCVPLVAAKTNALTAARIREEKSTAVSMDGATVNRRGVYNFVSYSPLVLLYGPARLGSTSATGANLLEAMKDSLQEPIMAVARLGSSAGGGPVAQRPRWRRLLEERVAAVITGSPSSMMRMRNDGVSYGTFLFGYGCAAHASNLVAQNAAKLEPFASALRHSLNATVFFMRCVRARTEHERTVATMAVPGQPPIPSMQPDSHTRWAGEAATVVAIQANLIAMRRTLFSNTLLTPPFDIPSSVVQALEAPSRDAIGRSTPYLKTLAAVVALLEADAAPLSSYAGLFATLRSSLGTHFLDLPAGTRAALQLSLSARYAAFSNPMIALAFYLDGFWGPARGQWPACRERCGRAWGR